MSIFSSLFRTCSLCSYFFVLFFAAAVVRCRLTCRCDTCRLNTHGQPTVMGIHSKKHTADIHCVFLDNIHHSRPTAECSLLHISTDRRCRRRQANIRCQANRRPFFFFCLTNGVSRNLVFFLYIYIFGTTVDIWSDVTTLTNIEWMMTVMITETPFLMMINFFKCGWLSLRNMKMYTRNFSNAIACGTPLAVVLTPQEDGVFPSIAGSPFCCVLLFETRRPADNNQNASPHQTSKSRYIEICGWNARHTKNVHRTYIARTNVHIEMCMSMNFAIHTVTCVQCVCLITWVLDAIVS